MNSNPSFGAMSGVSPGVAPGVASSVSTAGSPSETTDKMAGSSAPPIKRRAPIACRRCRRMRSKCIHDKATPPCKSCSEAGIAAEDCIFPVRGQPDNDRDYRHPRARADKAAKAVFSKGRRGNVAVAVPKPSASADDWDSLPPLDDLIDGVNRFTGHYFQLGFVPKQQFPERMRRDHRSVNLFLVLSILSISARLTPSLVKRYDTGVRAAEFFMERASEVAIGEIYQEPTLERCQAFYLLSIAQQGSALKNASYINMGISMRMAQLMQLHREETYQIQNPTMDIVIRAESARRTLWMLHSQDNLHSGPLSPVSLNASDITVLLPGNEEDFACGREPRSRAALEGTPPAVESPHLIRDPNRSLFATLMQIHNYWGIVGRRAVSYSRSSRPWELTSEFSQMSQRLRDWENDLPAEHKWNPFFLKAYKAEGQDLAYLCVTMMTRLCHIVLRRPYLRDIIKPSQKDPHRQPFFSSLAADLFRNVRELFEQVDAQFTNRTADESVGAQIASFCVYSCGLFSTYICKYPHICGDSSLIREGPVMLQRTIAILMECKEVWPLAARWAEALDKFSRDPKSTMTTEGSMADGKDPIPRAIRQLPDPIILPHPGTKPESRPSVTSSITPSMPLTSASTAQSSPHTETAPAISENGGVNGQPFSAAALSQQSSQQHSNPRTPQLHQSPTPQQQPQYQQQQQQHPQHYHPMAQQPHVTSPHQASHAAMQSQHPNMHAQQLQPQQQQQHHMQPALPGVSAPQSQLYMAGGPQHIPPQQQQHVGLHRQNGDGLGMLIEAFDSHQQPAPPYGLAPTPAAHADPNIPFFGQLAPGNDGFEGELQYYIDGNSAWLEQGGLLHGLR